MRSRCSIHPSGQIAALLSVLALALSGCGAELDTKAGEGFIATALGKQTGVKPKKVDCPSGIPVEKGKTFTCVAIYEENKKVERYRVVARQTNDDKVAVAVKHLVMPGVRRQVQRALSPSGAQLTVDCGGRRKLRKGDRFECSVVGPNGEETTALVTQSNSEGKLKIQRALRASVLAKTIQSGFRKSKIKARVTCPRTVPIKKGTRTLCTVKAGPETAKVRVTQTDSKGRIAIKIVKPSS